MPAAGFTWWGSPAAGLWVIVLAVVAVRLRPLCPPVLAGLTLAQLAVFRRQEREADLDSLRLVPLLVEAAAAIVWLAAASGAGDGWLHGLVSTHPGRPARLAGLAASPVLTA